MILSGRPCAGDTLSVRLGSGDGRTVGLWLSAGDGPTRILPGLTLPIDLPALSWLVGTIPAGGRALTTSVNIPTSAIGLRLHYASLALDLSASPWLVPGPSGEFTICGHLSTIGGVLLLDSSALDNGFSEVQRIASRYHVSPDWLVNDDRPTTTGNPWLRWNEFFPGDEVVLPGGSVDDEGWFTLPATTPWPVADLVNGIVPQNRLDQVPGITALRNEELRRLLGRTLVAIVHDSDISMNYRPLQTNLQGDRYGLFAFTVVEVRQPGSIPESGSSTSLYDLVVRVERPLAWRDDQRFPALDREPDSIQTETTDWSNGIVRVVGKSAAGHAAKMFVSIEGFTFASPMKPGPASDQFEYVARAPTDLTGRRVTISTDLGGSYTDRIQ